MYILNVSNNCPYRLLCWRWYKQHLFRHQECELRPLNLCFILKVFSRLKFLGFELKICFFCQFRSKPGISIFLKNLRISLDSASSGKCFSRITFVIFTDSRHSQWKKKLVNFVKIVLFFRSYWRFTARGVSLGLFEAFEMDRFFWTLKELIFATIQNGRKKEYLRKVFR